MRLLFFFWKYQKWKKKIHFVIFYFRRISYFIDLITSIFLQWFSLCYSLFLRTQSFLRAQFYLTRSLLDSWNQTSRLPLFSSLFSFFFILFYLYLFTFSHCLSFFFLIFLFLFFNFSLFLSLNHSFISSSHFLLLFPPLTFASYFLL